jgi:hypothetical protein
MTYFSEETINWEGMLEARARFDSLAEVLLHDPQHIIKTYAFDFHELATRGIPSLGGGLLALLFVPGLIFMLRDTKSVVLIVFAVAAVAQIALVNFKAFEPRFYLSLTPWIGAGAAYLGVALARGQSRLFRRGAGLVTVAVFAVSIGLAAMRTLDFAADPNHELAAAAPHLREAVAETDVLVARKPHASHVAGAQTDFLPEVTTAPELRAFLEETAARTSGSTFLFFGRIERQLRQELAGALDGGAEAPWLETVAGAGGPQGWALYRFSPPDGAVETGTRSALRQ